MSSSLHNPTTHDKVYKVAQRLFRFECDWNLARNKKLRFAIRRLAWERFILVYAMVAPDKLNGAIKALERAWERARENIVKERVTGRTKDLGA